MDIVRSLLVIHRFEIQHVANHVEFVDDAVAAVAEGHPEPDAVVDDRGDREDEDVLVKDVVVFDVGSQRQRSACLRHGSLNERKATLATAPGAVAYIAAIMKATKAIRGIEAEVASAHSITSVNPSAFALSRSPLNTEWPSL